MLIYIFIKYTYVQDGCGDGLEKDIELNEVEVEE